MKRFRVGIIGLGLIGKKRALNLGPKADLIAYCDLKKKNLYTNKKIKFYKNWKDLIQVKELDIIIISTTHVFLAPILLEACKYKKNIFIEKPASIDLRLLKKIISLSKLYKNKIRVGYNHRFYPSILKSRKIIDKGLIGKLMFIKSSYGHGGRPGYEKEWRLNSKLSGGGELIDQGSHLIDLSIFFLGKVKKIKSKINNYFWKTNVDDNAFVILEFEKKYISFFHVSCTEWKNNFTFEIYGTKGKLKIEGKGGSYGREKLTLYEMKKNVMLPFITTWKFQRNDTSWQTELNEFYDDINFGREPNPNLNQAYEVLKIVKSIYRSNKYDHCS